MAKLDPRDVRIDPLMTDVSVMFTNPKYVAATVAPIIPTTLDGGKYAVYNQADWFRNEAAKRAVGTRAKRGDYGLTFDTFFCEETAFAREVPDELKQNAMAPIQPAQEATEFATNKVLLAKEVRVANKIRTAANWTSSVTLAGVNQWSDTSSSDPVSDIEAAIDAIHGRTGYDANTMILPRLVWKKLKHHPDIIDRVKYTQRGVVTVELLQELFDIPRIIRADAIFTASNEAVAAGSETYQYVWGKDVWIGHVAPNPGVRIPTSIYQFQVGGAGGRQVMTWREEAEHQDVYESKEKCDEKVVSKLLGHLIVSAVA